MTDDVSIPHSKRLDLPRIFRQLGFTQKDIAAALALSATSISRFISPGDDSMNLRPENIRRLVNVLEERLVECRAIKSLGNDALEVRKNKGTDDKERAKARATVNAALALTTDTIKILEGEIAELLGDEPESSSAGRDPFIAMPGGALAVHATNYVPRRADGDIDAILTEGRSAASNVTGPINGGTSSFLNRVYQRAQGMRGCWARIVHLDEAFAKGETFTQLDLFRFLFRKIGVSDDVLTDDHLDVHDMKDAFDRWARIAWKDAARIVVVIDGLDQIFANAGAVADPLAVTNWLLALRNEASHGEPPYNNLALFVALTGQTWSAAHASPYASQTGSLALNKFTVPQVGQVFEQLGVGIDETGIQKVHRLFHGHPYLTQLFAWSMRDGSSQEETQEAALTLESRYETHWERMKSEIEFLIGDNYTLRKVLAVVAKVAAQPKPEPLDESEDQIWRSYRRGLRVFGLVDGSHAAPTICDFYRVAIEREQS